MLLKTFILTTIIFIILYVIQKIAYELKYHTWSRKGFKENSYYYITYFIFKFMYLICWISYLFYIFLEWYYGS